MRATTAARRNEAGQTFRPLLSDQWHFSAEASDDQFLVEGAISAQLDEGAH